MIGVPRGVQVGARGIGPAQNMICYSAINAVGCPTRPPEWLHTDQQASQTMFQTVELGQEVSKQEYKKRERALRKQLLDLQRELRLDGKFPVLVDFAGVSGAGKGTSTNLLNKWMDTRWISTHGYTQPAGFELERPEFWRFWRDLPPRGQIAINLSGRYSRPLLDYVFERISQDTFLQNLERINHFEKALADDGALVLKFWMHISQEVQKTRLETLENDPLHKWQISPDDWRNLKIYDRFIDAAEQIITHTNTGHAPWAVVEGGDFYYRSLRVGDLFREALELHLKKAALQKKYLDELNTEIEELGDLSKAPSNGAAKTILDGLDGTLELSKSSYRAKLERRQATLARLHQQAVKNRLSTILVFEGSDAAGKGGSIRQMTHALDARTYKVQPIAAPNDEENAHHYLWRFWRHLPRAGRMTIFDRSWYGRVLVERIEGFATVDEWRRAYAEINEFEDQLVEHGIVLLKFWLHIDSEEQLRRFKAREETPHKRWKLTEEDWRNHKKSPDYRIAAHEMIQQTSRQDAPWVLVESNDKLYGRIKILDTVCGALETALTRQANNA